MIYFRKKFSPVKERVLQKSHEVSRKMKQWRKLARKEWAATYHMHRVLTETSEVNKTGNVCTANIILLRVHVTIHTVDKQLILFILRFYFVAISTQHAMPMRHMVVCVMSDSTVMFHIIS
jgi:hypothetical protein